MINFTKKHYFSHKETIDNFVWRSLQMFGQQGVTFFIFILCAKLLTPYDFGVYDYALAVILLLIMFGDFGISTSTSKYVAEYNIKDKDKLRAVLFNSGLIIFVLTLVITLITLVIGPWYLKDKFTYVLYLLPLIFLAPMTSMYDGVYRGLKKFKQLAYISLFIGFISIFFVYFIVKAYGLTGALISQNLFYIILLLGLVLGYKEFHFKINRVVMKEISRYSFIYGIAIVGNYFFIKFGILILGHYNYIEQIATYELINRIFMILLLPFTLLGQVIAPNFAVWYSQKEYKKIYSKSIKYSIVFFLSGIILSGFIYVFLPILFNEFFNNYYKKDYFGITFLLCTLIYMINVWSATFDAGILIPTGYAKLMAKVYVIGGVFSVCLSLYLVNILHYIGVIISFLVCNFIFVVALRLFYLKKLFNLQNK